MAVATKYTSSVAVTTSDTVILQRTAAIYVGGTGDVKVGFVSGQTVTFKAVPVGTILPIEVIQIFATGTTATLMLALR